jgi:hypothetical protein
MIKILKAGHGDLCYNPRYPGGRDWEIMVQGQPRQKIIKTPSACKNLVLLVYTCHQNYAESICRKIMFQAALGKMQDLL